MIFASDLDRTLIYSEKFINDTNEKDVILLESKFKDNQQIKISYMYKKTLTRLKEIDSEEIFIPVTTRSLDQYRRIQLKENEITPMYAVTSNGGNILINGEVDQEWQEIISRQLDDLPLKIDQCYKLLSDQHSHPSIEEIKKVEGLFVYCLVDLETFSPGVLEAFQLSVDKQGWCVFYHGRKVYIIPKFIKKEEALRHIIDHYIKTSHLVVSAGDSNMDVGMAKVSDYFIGPRHGGVLPLIENMDKEKYVITEKMGFESSLEILEIVTKVLQLY